MDPAPTTLENTKPLNGSVAGYYDSTDQKPISKLMDLAPHVLILARCEGAPATAAYYTKVLKEEITEKLINTIKQKVRKGLLLVTHEELLEAALSHPKSASKLKRDPRIADPTNYIDTFSEAEISGKPAPRKRGRPRLKPLTPTKELTKTSSQAAAVQTTGTSTENENEEPNDLLASVDASLRAGGVPIPD